MTKIWSVVAQFEDWESLWFENLGSFSSLEKAKEVKEKWNYFFTKNGDLFLEPEHWNPKDDPYYEYDEDYKEDFTWRDSKQYEDIIGDYGTIRHFKHIEIKEVILDEETIMDSVTFSNPKLSNLMKSHNREWSINKIIE